jgi:dihydrofolate synthase/folylpolyglutamate synthase
MDGAHNEQKMQAFVTSFQKLYPGKQATVLLALKEGKEYQGVLPLLQPIASHLIITAFNISQDLPAKSINTDLLAAKANKYGFTSLQVEPEAEKALDLALQETTEIVVITGSFYLLSSLRPFILNAND